MDYLSEFMKECISSGKSSIPDIIIEAKNKIKNIEEQISKIENLKKEEKALKGLLKQINGESQNSNNIDVESGSLFSSLPHSIQITSISILELLEQCEDLTVRSIIDSVSSLEESKTVLMSLKWLIDNKIVFRSEENRKIFKGEKWLEKEKLLNIKNSKN